MMPPIAPTSPKGKLLGYDQPTRVALRCQELELYWTIRYKIGCWFIHNINVVHSSKISSLPGLLQRAFNFNGLLARSPADLSRAFMVTELYYYLFFYSILWSLLLIRSEFDKPTTV